MNILAHKYIDRFWGKIDKQVSNTFYNNQRCWIWTEKPNDTGYGYIRIKGKGYLAHRLSWLLQYGELDDSACVLHHCDNRLCVNPNHLFLGTRRDNVLDMVSKGRNVPPFGERNGRYTHPETTAKGERNGMSKLSDTQVLEIRTRYAYHGRGGEDAKTLSKIFGVAISTICRIVKKKIRI